jgi:hypothetical protein
MLQDLSLERFLIYPKDGNWDNWDWSAICGNPEASKIIKEAEGSGGCGLGFHPELGWMVLCSGQGAFVGWHQRGDLAKWTGENPSPRKPWTGTIYADDHFSIGSAHTVCQDYTRSRNTTTDGFLGGTCAIVSDGCSASKDSDFGARFMTLCALKEGSLNGILPMEASRIASGAETAGGILLKTFLDRECLNATCLFAGVRKDGLVQVQAFGDGVIVVRRRDGSIETYEVDHGGIPAYPAYLLDPELAEQYKAEMTGKLKVKVTVDGKTVDVWDISCKKWPEFSFTVDPADTDLVVLMTDGAQSFQNMTGMAPVPVPLAEVVSHVLDFKSMTGSFLNRRLHAFETKECPKLGWRHYDDFGVAALWMMEETK